MKTCNDCGKLNINKHTEPVATWSIHDVCDECSINDYITFRETCGYSDEEKAEIRANLDGDVMDCLTGELIQCGK